MATMIKLIAAFLVFLSTSVAWVPTSLTKSRHALETRLEAAVGLFYGTSMGSTQEVADKIYEAFGEEVASEPVDVETLKDVAAAFSQHNALIVGTPTWNTGADFERSGTGWDELYYNKLPELKSVLDNKKVAVFGLGDQVSYSDNYADATGELFDAFEGLGCKMLGAWSQEGYEHQDSKSIRDGKFCGLLLDVVNQEELTDERVEKWVAQLKAEGILEGSGSAATVPAPPAEKKEATPLPVSNTSRPAVKGTPNGASSHVTQLEQENEKLHEQLEESSKLLDKQIASHDTGGFTPHYNPVTGKTMWTSPDGRKSYVTVEKKTTLNP